MKKEEKVEGEHIGQKSEEKAARTESVERRKRLKKADRAARWSGFILLICMLLLAAVMWVIGELNTTQVEPSGVWREQSTIQYSR